MVLADMAAQVEQKTQPRVSELLAAEGISPLRDQEVFAVLAALCKHGKFETAMEVVHLQEETETFHLGLQFVAAAQGRQALAGVFGDVRLVVVGRPTRLFDVEKASQGLAAISRRAVQRWDLPHHAPVYGGRVAGPAFRKVVKALRHGKADDRRDEEARWFLLQGGADVFFVRPYGPALM